MLFRIRFHSFPPHKPEPRRFCQGNIMLGRTTIAIKPMGHEVCDAAERQQNKLMHLLFKKEYLLIGHEVLKQLVPISRRVSLDVALFAPYSLFFLCVSQEYSGLRNCLSTLKLYKWNISMAPIKPN